MTVSQLIALLLLLVPQWQEGGITWYYGQPFEGTPLKCPGYKYEQATGPWIGLDITWYEQGLVQCGDLYVIEFYDGSRMLARALESGHLDYRVWPKSLAAWDSGLPYIADLPRYWRDGRDTRTGRIFNVSYWLRTRISGFPRLPRPLRNRGIEHSNALGIDGVGGRGRMLYRLRPRVVGRN